MFKKIKEMYNLFESHKEHIFCFSYGLYVFSSAFLVNFYKTGSHVGKLLAFGLMALLSLYNVLQIQKKDIVKNIIVLSIVVFTGLTIEYRVLMLFLFVYSYQSINFNKFIELDFKIRLLSCSLTFIFCTFGLIDNYILETYRGNILVSRYSLGFSHPNSCFLMLFIILVDYLLLQVYTKEKLSISNTMFTILIAYFFNLITNSRAGFLLITFFTIVIYFESNFHIINKFPRLNKSLIYSSLICLGISFLLVQIYIHFPNIGNKLNSLFTNRISSMYRYYIKYGFSFFGQHIEKIATAQAALTDGKALVLDNLYANLLITYGLTFSALYFWLNVKTTQMLFKNNNLYILILYFIIAVYGLVEGMPLNLDYNYFVVLTTPILFSQKTYMEVKNTKYEY